MGSNGGNLSRASGRDRRNASEANQIEVRFLEPNGSNHCKTSPGIPKSWDIGAGFATRSGQHWVRLIEGGQVSGAHRSTFSIRSPPLRWSQLAQPVPGICSATLLSCRPGPGLQLQTCLDQPAGKVCSQFGSVIVQDQVAPFFSHHGTNSPAIWAVFWILKRSMQQRMLSAILICYLIWYRRR